MNATGHCPPKFECVTCDSYFQSQRAVSQHMDALAHWGETSESEDSGYECDDCDETFSDEDTLRSHEIENHFYCDPCDRYFQNQNSITQVCKISSRS